ncbi:MAG TPA: carboxypeptidase M32 [Methanomassiliicoccales archaeon]|nr:carboxypeptidase M32 [Methanomassiliicoccales archaeon]
MTPNDSSAYSVLMERSKEMFVLGSATDVLYWDMETKMPPRALAMRGEQLSAMELLIHKKLTDPEIPRLLEQCEKDQGSFDVLQKRNVHLFRKSYNESAKLPDSLVTETAKHRTQCNGSWKKAKAAKDFKMFRDDLAKMIELREQAADILMQVKGTKTPYDALLDQFEPNMTAERINEIFAGLRDGLIKLIDKVQGADFKPDLSIMSLKVPIEVQRKISIDAMNFIGYDTMSEKAGGRLDETEHPFTVGTYDDVRITTHYYEDRFFSSLFSVMHEGGHALYDQGIPREWMFQPIGTPCSYGIHESQSRFVENIVGRSPEFLNYALPRFRKFSSRSFKGSKNKDIIAAANAVNPSKIRVEADEVTYALHVIIRFEIEKDIFAHKLTVDELPQAWNQKYADYLGVKIENDGEGVLQDTHWSGGSFGYFPSYALGNIYSGMFLDKMNKDVPQWKKGLRKGEFSPVLQWLGKNVHSKGDLYDPADLIREVTGKELTISPFLKYLEEKMSKIYGF